MIVLDLYALNCELSHGRPARESVLEELPRDRPPPTRCHCHDGAQTNGAKAI